MRIPFEIIVVSSDLERRRYLAAILTELGLDPICASTLRECNDSLAQNNVGLVFCDWRVADGSYQDLLNVDQRRRPKVVLTARSWDHQEFFAARQWGAFGAISTPCRPTDVEWIVIQATRDARGQAVPCF